MLKKTSSSKKSLKDKVLDRKRKVKERSSGGKIIFLKADTTLRCRVLNVGDDNEFIKEVVYFYLGADIKGVISPATYGLPCAIMEKYEELKSSKDSEDKDLAKKFSPKSKFLPLVMVYKDERGKQVDEENSEKLVLLTSGLYQEATDYYLDEEDWGDPTDWKKGYDWKLKRVGSGKMDTEYTIAPCPKSPTPKKYARVYDLDKAIKAEIPSYERTKELIDQYLGTAGDDDDDNPRPKKKKRSDLDAPIKSSKFKKKFRK